DHAVVMLSRIDGIYAWEIKAWRARGLIATVLDGKADEIRRPRQIELLLDASARVRDRLVGDADRLCDPLKAFAFAEHAQDLDLAVGELAQRILGAHVAHHEFAGHA